MNRFDYVRADSVAQAVAAAARPGAVYLAAGTNLLDLMKGGVTRPSALVDITRIPGSRRDRPPCLMAVCGSAPWCATATWRMTAISPPATRWWRKPCSPAHRRSYATRRRSAAT